ncbi:ethanolamine-phosphate cytidylyltransferase-like, partial [Trifolium medium]|nr:ethanolamine-phosphate cytidylyltransferase-like [Trifolium medium]
MGKKPMHSGGHFKGVVIFSNGRGQKFDDSVGVVSSGTRVSHFLPTSRRIVQFSNGR